MPWRGYLGIYLQKGWLSAGRKNKKGAVGISAFAKRYANAGDSPSITKQGGGLNTAIHTYPETNETIKDLLRRSEEPVNLYIVARIEELERQLAGLRILPTKKKFPLFHRICGPEFSTSVAKW